MAQKRSKKAPLSSLPQTIGTANPRITKKERGLIKGAIRRVFARSELRKKVLDAAEVKGHRDSNRPRVTKWARCAEDKNIVPKYTCEVDHIDPVIPLDKQLDDLDSWDTVIDRVWCEEENQQVLCEQCHDTKSASERKQRAILRKARVKRLNNKSKETQ